MTPNRLREDLRSTWLGLGVNLVLAGIKLAAGIVGHSQALVADAVESAADILGSLLVWRSVVVAARPADAEHPYGHGKAESIAAAAVATLLLGAAAGIASHAVEALFVPLAAPDPWTLAPLAGAAWIKQWLARRVTRAARASGNRAVLADGGHHRADAITSLAAGVGILVTWIGGPNFVEADAAAAIVAAGIIGWNGWRILRPALEDLMDATPQPEVLLAIRRIAEATPGVDNVEKCLARRMGWQVLVDMHVRVRPDLTVVEAHAIAHQVKDAVRQALPQVGDVLVHIEPTHIPNKAAADQ